MNDLSFTIHFHGPFHVARGQAERGLDRPVDPEVPLPASSIKGLLRAEAVEQLGIEESVVSAVFGDRKHPCPWAFSDATFGDRRTRRAARIKLDDDGQVANRFLMIGEQVWARQAGFTVIQVGTASDLVRDRLVLTAAAQSVTSLGGARRRGEGWVSIVRDHFVWDDASSTALIGLANGAPA